MLLRTHSRAPRSTGRRGAALMVSVLVLLVLIAIVFQISMGTGTDARVTRNVVGTTEIEWTLESALLRVYDELAQDAATDDGGAGGAAAGPGGLPVAGAGDAGAAMSGAALGGAAGGGGRIDSRQDDWATAKRTRELNDIELRIMIQDEDSKLNVLGMLTENEEEAQKAFDRVVRVLDFCREGTREDIDGTTAMQMAEVMREVLGNRSNSTLPQPVLLTDDEELEDRSLPLSLRDFVVYEPFEEQHFRDYRDEDGTVVHSIESFLTTWTAVRTLEEELQVRAQEASAAEADAAGASGPAGGEGPITTASADGTLQTEGGGPATEMQGLSNSGPEAGPGGVEGAGAEEMGKGGIAVNVNTAPRAVLEALFDDRDVERRFWSEVVEYRNLEEEVEGEEDIEPTLDEFGEEIIVRQIFRDVSEISTIDGYDKMEPLFQQEAKGLIRVSSDVFSIYLTGRRRTGANSDSEFTGDREERREQEEAGDSLTVSMRCVVWRRNGADGFELVPLVRWEQLDYVPYEVLDFPDEER